MSVLGLFRPGSSPVHRASAGTKLLLLLGAGVSSVFVRDAWQVGVAVGVVAAAWMSARLPLRLLVRQARPLLWVLLAVGAFHLLVSGWERAVVVCGVILCLVLLAAVVTLTTRTTAMVDTVVRVLGPLRRLGLDPERVGLLLALSVRSVPVVVGIAEEVRDAQRARGLAASPRAYAVPLIVRSLRHADQLGEALVARGIDD
jgi:biotin transport system permease protein